MFDIVKWYYLFIIIILSTSIAISLINMKNIAVSYLF